MHVRVPAGHLPARLTVRDAFLFPVATSEGRRARIPVYVAGEGMEPTVRGLLASRFGPLHTGRAVPSLLAGVSPPRKEAA